MCVWVVCVVFEDDDDVKPLKSGALVHAYDSYDFIAGWPAGWLVL